MHINDIKTITELSRLDGRVYVHLPSCEVAAQFMQQAESEGFTFANGAKPTERTAHEVMAINPNHTINYIGLVGHIAFGARANRIGEVPLLRFTVVLTETGSIIARHEL